jgi:hypothetical protein
VPLEHIHKPVLVRFFAVEKIRGSFNKLLQTPLNTPYLLSGFNQIEVVFRKQIALDGYAYYGSISRWQRACRHALSTPRPPCSITARGAQSH